MKFISKSSNLLVVLRPGMSASPLTGTPAKSTVSVRFKDGVAEVPQQELIDMMLSHPGFKGDFISVEDNVTDPYAILRKSSEPGHTLTEMKFGTPISRKIVGGDNPISSLSPDIQKALKSMATEMAKAMLPEMLKGLVEAHKADKLSKVTESDTTNLTKAGKPKKRPGRKAKNKVSKIESVPPVISEEVVTQEIAS